MKLQDRPIEKPWRALLASRLMGLLLLVPAGLALGACSPDTISVGIEPTATPVSTHYLNEAYGFAFDYPASWALREAPQLVKLGRGTLELRIGYRWAAEPAALGGGRTGMPAGDLVYADKVYVLDQVVPAAVLEHERKAKMVLYGEDGRIEDGDLRLEVWLEDLGGGPDEEIDISREAQAEAKAILESFERVAASASPPTPAPTASPLAADASATYTNAAFGFAFEYPAQWSLTEVPSTKVAEPGPFEPGDGAWSAERVELALDALRIHIQFQPRARPGAEAGRNIVSMAGHGGVYGDAVRSEMAFMGAEATRMTWRYEGETKAINIEFAPPESDLVLRIELFDGSRMGPLEEAAGLPASAIETLDRIARSFLRTR